MALTEEAARDPVGRGRGVAEGRGPGRRAGGGGVRGAEVGGWGGGGGGGDRWGDGGGGESLGALFVSSGPVLPFS